MRELNHCEEPREKKKEVRPCGGAPSEYHHYRGAPSEHHHYDDSPTCSLDVRALEGSRNKMACL